MNILIWHVYMILDKSDIQKSLESYQLRTGRQPKYARVSAKAPAELVEMIRSSGLIIEVANNLLSRDIWLSDEQARF